MPNETVTEYDGIPGSSTRSATANDAQLVFLPACSSRLDWIEAYIRWRNARARPKTGFATDSPIRTRTHHPIKVA